MKRRKTGGLPEYMFKSKSCTGKKKYRTEAEACDMIHIQMEYGKPMDDVRPYLCEFCNKWHLGHGMK